MHRLSSSILVLVVVLLQTILGLYEDQIGKFDWRHQYIGRVSHSSFDASGKKVIVGTEENVLAVLHAGTGKIEWRHLLGVGPKNKVHHLFNVDGTIVTVSGTPATLRAFDQTTGVVQWESVLMREVPPALSLFAADAKEATVVEVNPSRSAGYELSVSKFSLTNGQESNQPAADLPWFSPELRCQLVHPHLVCLAEDTLNVMDVHDPLTHQRISLDELGISSRPEQMGIAKGFLWIKTADRFHVYKVTNNGVRPIARSPGETLMMDVPTVKDSAGQYLSFLVANGGDYLVRIHDIEANMLLDSVGGQLKMPEGNGRPEVLSTYLTKKSGGDLSYRFVVTTSDDALLYGSKKEVYWTREESLTSIIQVDMVDLPVSETEASIEEEFGPDVGGIFGHAVKRIVSQLRQVVILFRHVVAGQSLQRSSDGASSKALVRDRFGLHKLIIIVTRPGKLFAMDTVSGRIVWQRLLDIKTDNARLYVQRTSIHYPLESQCALLAKSSTDSEQSVLYVFHPITGEGSYVKLGYGVQQAMLLPHSAETEYLKPLLMLDHLNQPHVYPASAANRLVEMSDHLYFFTADTKSCLMKGYSFAKSTVGSLKATPVWQLQLCSSTESTPEEIISIVGRHPDEKVHSQGRVLADRSVLYKYLNPNLAAVTTAGSNHPHHKGYLNLYLVDVVTGSVVFSASHRRVQPPYHLVMAENWVVYSYYNEKYRRTELGSLELLEGPTQANSTAFSSYGAPQPLVDRQAYIYPAHITAMKDTFSEQGMTAKHILLGLSNGWIQELPRAFLDPRRPVVAAITPEMREESIMPYVPELPTPAEAVINYNQTVLNVRNIYVSPSSLESTGLVFAYGLDIFFTHVTPSKTFDVLNDDFEYFFIALVLSGLTLASLITKRLASKKALRQAWK